MNRATTACAIAQRADHRQGEMRRTAACLAANGWGFGSAFQPDFLAGPPSDPRPCDLIPHPPRLRLRATHTATGWFGRTHRDELGRHVLEESLMIVLARRFGRTEPHLGAFLNPCSGQAARMCVGRDR